MSRKENLLFVGASLGLTAIVLTCVFNQRLVMRTLEDYPVATLGSCLALGFLGIALGLTGKVIEYKNNQKKKD